jgi:hypothetical protein
VPVCGAGAASLWTDARMYVPSYTREEDREVLFELVDEYPFATLVTTTSSEPIVSHLPLLLNRESAEPCLLENEGNASSLELATFTRRYFQRRGGE